MAYKFVDADKLDSDLTAVADAIREKSGTSESLAFPDGFNTAIMAIESGAELNFDIVGSTDKPANPKDNTIWINTNVPITGWTFSATQPEAPADGQDGWVWFSTGNSSEVSFNALKKNAIEVYPNAAKQYIGGMWEDVAGVQSCQGGKWVDWWNGELYKNGNQYESVTGGWKVVNGAGETATLAADCITFRSTGNSDRSASAYTKNVIDVSKYSQLVVSGNIITPTATQSKDALTFGFTNANTAAEPTWMSKRILNTVGVFEQDITIEGGGGPYYVALYAHAADVDIHKVQLK